METDYQLDADELYHLAVVASEEGRHEDAIGLLKQSIALQPTASSHYILAAEHAEIGMLERAIEGMGTATELDPQLWTAHLQRGLLHMMLNRSEEAIAAWQPLQQLDRQDPLFCFGAGLTSLLQGDSAAAQTGIEQGIALNTANPALNGDMHKVLASLAAHTGDDSADDGNATGAGDHLLLAAYHKDDSGPH